MAFRYIDACTIHRRRDPTREKGREKKRDREGRERERQKECYAGMRKAIARVHW